MFAQNYYKEIQDNVSAVLQVLNKYNISELDRDLIGRDFRMILTFAKMLYDLCNDYHYIAFH